MPTFSSVQEANRLAVPLVRQTPTDYYGRVRTSTFEYVTTGAETTSDIIQLTMVPLGAKIISGKIAFGSFGSGLTASIGYTGAPTRYLNAGAIATAGTLTFADSVANNTNDILTAQQGIILTVGGGTAAASIKLYGHIDYVVD